MTVTKLISHPLQLAIWAALLLCFLPLTVNAQSKDTPGLSNDETTVWFFEGPTLPQKTIPELTKGLREALAAEKGNHVLGDAAFKEYIKTRRPSPPECLVGKTTCGTAKAMAFDALNMALLVQVKLRQSEGRLEAAYTIVDRRGKTSNTKIARADNARQLAFSLVGAIYKSTGIVQIKSTPAGASIQVNGANVGQTPLKQRLPIGKHQYTLQLKTFKVIKGTFEVAPTGTKVVENKLEKMPGVLILENPPPGAQIIIEGQAARPANEPIELPAGDYKYELIAPGHQNKKDTLRIEAGSALNRDAALKKLNPLLRSIDQQAVKNNRFSLRVSYDHSIFFTTFRGARASDEDLGTELEFRKFKSDDSTEVDPTRFFDPNGVRLEMAYSSENFGITLLSLGYLSDSRTHDAITENLKTGKTLPASVEKLTQVQIRPLQVFYRYFYQNLVPSVELGVGINLQWIDMEVAGLPTLVSFGQTEAFWTMGLGLQYFFTPRWFASVRYNFHDHLNTGVGVQHNLSLGFGGALPNLFGVEPEPPNKI